jgi:ABC-2 type transport system permease protein
MMSATLTDTWAMTLRHLRNLMRQPWYIAFTLVQPLIYLLLFSELFKRVVELPGFEGGSYLTFLTPGVVVMTAAFSAGWNGMSMIEDIDRGVLDRLLVTPVSRGALIFGRLVQLAVVTVIQSLIIFAVGYLRGADYPGGVPGLLAVTGGAVLLAAAVGALSNGMALIVRNQESVIGVVNFIMLPLTFLSSVFMAKVLMPGWMQDAVRFNPLNWAADAGREALRSDTDWNLVASRGGMLLTLILGCAWLATRAFRGYQRSL